MVEPGDLTRRIHDLLASRPMNVSFVDEFVGGSARPFSRRAVLYLRQKFGIKSILTLTEKPLPSTLIEGMEYKHIPIRNHHAPTVEELEESVKFLISQSAKKNKVVVHCAAGKGRTGTVLAAYLCAKDGYSAREAIKLVRARRPGSIETRQESVLEQFEKHYQRI